MARLNQFAETQPARIRDQITEAINTPKTYIDFKKLADELIAGENPFKTGLSKCIDVNRLVIDVRGKKGPLRLSDLMETRMDV